jgi:hypothetical protein
VKRQAEAEGLDAIFRTAGADWREPGCSMCIAMNGDSGRPGERIVSTSNRNFAGRQGRACAPFWRAPPRRPPPPSPAPSPIRAVFWRRLMLNEPITKVTSRSFVIKDANIDTDQIIPARFLTTTERGALGEACFHDWRFTADGAPTDHPLNQVNRDEQRILIAGIISAAAPRASTRPGR